MNRNTYKYIVIAVSYSVAFVSYPFIRLNGNWIPADFVHLAPELHRGMNDGNILEVFGNSLHYPIIFDIISTVTNLGISDVYLYAIPYAASIFLPVVLYLWATITSEKRIQQVFAIGLISFSGLLLQMRMLGKHTMFTFSLFFISLYLIYSDVNFSSRIIAVLTVLIYTLSAFHIHISTMFVIFLAAYWVLSNSSSKFFEVQNPLRFTLVTAAGVGIGWYSIMSPYRRAILVALLPPYPNIQPSSGGIGAKKEQSGLEQFITVLTLRWEPWWVWVILTLPLLLLLIYGGALYLRQSVKILKRREIPDYYILVTIAGLFGVFVANLSVLGFSATNLIFRYLRYFLPISFLLIIAETPAKIFDKKNMKYFLLLLLVSSMILNPIKYSREPEFHSLGGRTYESSETDAIQWFDSYGRMPLIVYRLIPIQAIYYHELDNYIPDRDLPVRANISVSSKPGDSIVYDNGETAIHANERVLLYNNSA